MPLIPQSKSSYEVHPTCQIENLGWLLEQLPSPFGIFHFEKKGRLVEVGAFDGITYSNHYGLLSAGWPAILIEPMPENFSKCAEEHKHKPWVVCENVAVGEKEGTLDMFFEREGSRIAKPDEQKVSIPVKTLDSILKKHKWKPDFDLLVIDTEDYEQPVLKGFDLEYYRPKLCIIETHGWQRHWIHNWFSKLYRIYSEDGLNTLFVRKDWCP